MEVKINLKGLTCANCGAKIQREVSELEEVIAAELNLMNQTLTLQTEKGTSEALLVKVEKIVHSREPHVAVSLFTEKPEAEAEKDDGPRKMLLRLAVGAAVYGLGLILMAAALPFYLFLPVLVVAYLILGGDVVLKAARNIVKGRVFDENFLMSLSTVGAFFIGEYPEAVAVMLLYQIGELFQDMAVRRSRRSIAELMDIRPDCATVVRHGVSMVVSPDKIRVGETILVKPGEKVPLDGIVLEGSSMLDTRALTGESVPKTVKEGDSILSGCVNGSGVLTIQVTKVFGESTATKIIELVEHASSRKAPTENFITTFARYYTPVVVILAALLAVVPPLFFGQAWTEWIRRAFVFLVVSCPCALVISIPLTFFGGIGAASRHGVLVKGSNYLEALNRVDTVVFDKTGTLTEGVFQVSEIIPADGISSEKVLCVASQVERYSNHPIARSIVEAYGKDTAGEIANYREIPGMGVGAELNGKPVLAGNGRLLESEGISFTPCQLVGTKVYIVLDRVYLGCVVIRDRVKQDSKMTISQLREYGIKNTVMLTGDEESLGQAVAKELGIDQCYAGLLPGDKVELLESGLSKGKKLIFVGDGINDAPVLARADVGIAMGGLGSDAAIEASDVVLMTDEPSKLLDAMKVARAVRRIVVQNIVFSLSVKVLFLILGALGIAGMWVAVFGDVGVALMAVVNAMRILRK